MRKRKRPVSERKRRRTIRALVKVEENRVKSAIEAINDATNSLMHWWNALSGEERATIDGYLVNEAMGRHNRLMHRVQFNANYRVNQHAIEVHETETCLALRQLRRQLRH